VVAICASSAARTIAISSHGNALSLLINRVHPSFGLAHASNIRNPDVFCMRYRAGELVWEAEWRAPGLYDFASHHDETPFPGRPTDPRSAAR
jgi:broad specificity phosphatase PhoE